MTEQAQRQAREERRWWRKHRVYKNIFNDELRKVDQSMVPA
jgi:hypothetical protein